MDFQINLDPAMLGGAGIVFVVGIGIVFVVLVLLILLLTVESKIFTTIGNRKKAPKAAEKKPAPAPAPVAVAPAAANDDEEIAAVIAAVIAMYSESGNGLVVRSVRRVGSNTPAWSASGRQEYINTRY